MTLNSSTVQMSLMLIISVVSLFFFFYLLLFVLLSFLVYFMFYCVVLAKCILPGFTLLPLDLFPSTVIVCPNQISLTCVLLTFTPLCKSIYLSCFEFRFPDCFLCLFPGVWSVPVFELILWFFTFGCFNSPYTLCW